MFNSCLSGHSSTKNSQWSSELTFESFCPAVGTSRGGSCGPQKFSKVSCIVVLLDTYSSDLTVENFCVPVGTSWGRQNFW